MNPFSSLGSLGRSNDAQVVWKAIQAFVGADTWQETYQVLQQNRRLLLSDLADKILTVVIDDLRSRSGDDAEALAEVFIVHHALLQRCREVGIDSAWKEFQAWLASLDEAQPEDQQPGRQEAIVGALQAFLNASSWDGSYQILVRNKDLLLTDEAEQILANAIEEAQSQRGSQAQQIAASLAVHLYVLHRCREIGLEAGWREFLATLDEARHRRPPSSGPQSV